MAVEKYYIPITQEGQTGPVRGKIPSSMVNYMRAEDGDVLVIEVNKRTIVGGHIASGKEAAKYRQNITPRGRTGGAKSTSNKKVGKKVKKTKEVTQPKKKVKKLAKPNKRKTSVKYDTAPSKKKKKLKLKRPKGW